MGLLRAVAFRLGIGLGVTFIGLLIALIRGNWYIFTNTTSLIGILLLIIGGLPLVKSSFRPSNHRMEQGKSKSVEQMQKDRDATMSWALSLLLVALPVVIIPSVAYVLFLK